MREGGCRELPPLFRDGVVVGVDTFIMTRLHLEASVNVLPSPLQASRGDPPISWAAGACRGQGRGKWQISNGRQVLTVAR